jgi:hypothetical protein
MTRLLLAVLLAAPLPALAQGACEPDVPECPAGTIYDSVEDRCVAMIA